MLINGLTIKRLDFNRTLSSIVLVLWFFSVLTINDGKYNGYMMVDRLLVRSYTGYWGL